MRMQRLVVVLAVMAIAVSGVVPALAGTALAGTALAENINNSGKGLAELATLYEQRAEEQANLVIEHQAMKKKAQRHLNKSEPGSNQAEKYQEMIQHCEEIIVSARNLRREYLGLAEWFEENEFPLDY